MQIGEYIYERLLPVIVKEICEQRSIAYRSFSDDWILRLKNDHVIRWIVGYKFDINSSAASAVAQDKVATYLTLEDAGIPSVPHYLVRSIPGEPLRKDAVKHQIPSGSKVVCKPLFGTGGHDVTFQDDIEQALQHIGSQPEPAWTISPHLDIRTEIRCIVLDGEPLLVFEKYDPTDRDGLKLFNLSHGAKARNTPLEAVDPEIIQLAKRAMDAISLRVAAVDIITTPDGNIMILEVNDGITLEHYGRASEENRKQVFAMYDAIVTRMMV